MVRAFVRGSGVSELAAQHPYDVRMVRHWALALATVLLAACDSSSSAPDLRLPDLPADDGPLPTGAVVWAIGDTIHVGDQTIQVERPVRRMVGASGRVYFTQGLSHTLWMTDGETTRRTGYETDELRASADGRYVGFLDQSRGMPWSTVVVDLDSGEAVVDDHTGMGDPGDDLADLYEDAEPQVLGFDNHELYVKVASGNDILSWDPGTGRRTEHPDRFFFAEPDPGGGRVLPALVRDGRLIVPDDPYRSTQWGHVSPRGTIAIQPTGRRTRVFDVRTGRPLSVDFTARWFILGGWTDHRTAYGLAYDRRPYGPGPMRLVRCHLTVDDRRCQALRTVRPKRHQTVLFPTGSSASY